MARAKSPVCQYRPKKGNGGVTHSVGVAMALVMISLSLFATSVTAATAQAPKAPAAHAQPTGTGQPRSSRYHRFPVPPRKFRGPVGSPKTGPGARQGALFHPAGMVSDMDGNTLAVTDASVGSFNASDYTDTVPSGATTYYENCLEPTDQSTGALLPMCAYVQLHDAKTGTETSTTNTQEDTIYDACNDEVDDQTTYGWELVGTDYLVSGYIGSLPTTVPTSGVCYGLWKVVYQFSETFNDNNVSATSATGYFDVSPPTDLTSSNTDGGNNHSSRLSSQCSEGSHPVNCATGDFYHPLPISPSPAEGSPSTWTGPTTRTRRRTMARSATAGPVLIAWRWRSTGGPGTSP